MLVRSVLANGHGIEGPNGAFIMLPCIPLYIRSSFHRFARMGLPRGPLAAAAAAAVHGLLALGLWSSTPAPACPQPVCPAPSCPALVCPDCVSAAGAPDPGPPGGPAALGEGKVPEDLAEIRSAAVRLEEQLAAVQAALEAAWSAWPLLWLLLGGAGRDLLGRVTNRCRRRHAVEQEAPAVLLQRPRRAGGGVYA